MLIVSLGIFFNKIMKCYEICKYLVYYATYSTVINNYIWVCVM